METEGLDSVASDVEFWSQMCVARCAQDILDQGDQIVEPVIVVWGFLNSVMDMDSLLRFW